MQVELAVARQERVARLADVAAVRSVRVWRSRMSADFDAAWAGIVAELTGITAAGQVAAAAGASRYLAATAAADGIDAPDVAVQAAAFAGVDGSGRTLEGLLYGAVTTAKSLVGAGAGVQQALTGGAAYLSTMAHTAVLDTGRSADLTAMTGKRYTHYVRVVSAGACSRCAILAGTSSAKTPFLRHPRCRCTAAPETGEGRILTATGRYSSPDNYFQSLSAGEQDRVFTKAGADAIRAGADPITVVTARSQATGIAYDRRGINPGTLPNSGRRLQRSIIGSKDGQPVWGYTTAEGTTRHGQVMKNQARAGLGTGKRIRLMPETVVALTDDVTLRAVLLRDAGYLSYPTNGATAQWVAKRAELVRADRATADAFYRSHGITLG